MCVPWHKYIIQLYGKENNEVKRVKNPLTFGFCLSILKVNFQHNIFCPTQEAILFIQERMGFMKKHFYPLPGVVILAAAFVLNGCAQKTMSESIIFHIQSSKDRSETSIWQVDDTGSHPTQVASFGWFADYSPDNSRIVFGEFYNAGIWVMETGGNKPTRLTDFGSTPDWSPDGKMIAFSSGTTEGAKRFIWVMNADGSGAHQISTVSGSAPDWSPDGKTISFHGEVNNGIWLINPDGSGEIRLEKMGAYPAWSPDGKNIAYVSLEDWCIWVMSADGTRARKITDHTGLLPVWSADGKRIAYESGRRDEEGKPTDVGIWIINVDGSDDHFVIKDGNSPDWTN